MSHSPQTDGVRAGRLDAATLEAHFDDLYPMLNDHEARVAADRCYFCHDAPCVTACPTAIDIPLFIRQIQTGTAEAAARTILAQNILGGMCARVCPTETLCEGSCVRNTAEGNAVEIGRLQRYATDGLLMAGEHPFTRAAPTGKSVAVVGAGPAALACAHRLAMLGHDVVMHEARALPGGLNEYGIAGYKAANGIAQAEVDWLLQIGGIKVITGSALGREVTLEELRSDHCAVFLGMGLAGVNGLRIQGEDLPGVRDAVEFIAELRQCEDLSSLPIGRRVVVIGGGMTAVDAAVQSRLLGAEHVHMVYRRGREAMSASDYELDHAATEGVSIVTEAMPVAIRAAGKALEVEFAYTRQGAKGLERTGEGFVLPADQVFKAIGQTLAGQPEVLTLEGGKIAIDAAGRTSLPMVWAGGDCALGGEDLTVTAVAQGRDAAMDIHASLTGAAV